MFLPAPIIYVFEIAGASPHYWRMIEKVKVSILHLAPISEGSSATEALKRIPELARLTDSLGCSPLAFLRRSPYNPPF